MKKILFLAMAAVAMVGCTQNEEIENAGQQAEIKFGTAVSSTTRAAVTDLAELKKADVGFTVYAYNTGSSEMSAVASGTDLKSFMDGVLATFDTDWTLSGSPYYWPLTSNIQFFAYGNPGTSTLAYNAPDASSKYPSITYTVADIERQTDLVVASVLDANKTKNVSGVSLAFNHVLTQVNFTIKTADDCTYKLKSLSISGVNNKGIYDFETSSWKQQGGTATYEHAIDVDGITVANGADGTKLDVAWMLMPQTLPTTGAAINLAYDIFSTDGELIGQVTSDAIDLNGTTAWGQGKKIRYTLTLTNKGAKITLVVPEVGLWDANEDNVNK